MQNEMHVPDLSSKEIMWEKLSTLPGPDPFAHSEYDMLSMRFKLKQFMGLSDEEIDRVIDSFMESY